MRYSKESLDAEKRKDPDKTGARLSTQVSYSPQHSQKREQKPQWKKKKSEWEEKSSGRDTWAIQIHTMG